MEQHLTVREACKFADKSESTLKRLIREITSQPDHEDRGLILPSPEEVERRKQVGDMFVWKINKDLLIKRFPKDVTGQEKGSAASANPAGSAGQPDSPAIIDVLREQLQSKDRQIQTLETQLDRKDEQIKSQNERMHESNVLMRELQAKLAIPAPAPKKESADSIVTEEGDSRPAKAGRGPTAKQPKPTSFFGGLFRKR